MTETLEVPVRARLEGVDVLRGLSVLLVVMHHIHLRFVLNGFAVDDVLPKTLNQVLFWSGYYAVIAFFVISGFLITSLSIRRWGSPARIRMGQFYWMRFSRIAPCMLLLLAILSALHIAGAPDFTIKPERASLGQALLAALTFHVNWLEGHHGYLPGGWDILWSLSVEEIFYVVFPLLCVFLRRERWLVWPLLALILIGPINRTMLAERDPWGSYAYLSCMDGIAFGCLAALAVARLRLSPSTLRIGLAAGAIAVTLVILLCNEDEHINLVSRYGLNVTILELGVASMLVALGNGIGSHAMTRGTGWLRMVGRSSYEIYLFHMIVVLTAIHIFKRNQPVLSTAPAWYAAILVASVLLGYVVSRLYSEPLNHRLRLRYLQASQTSDVAVTLAAHRGPC